MKGIPKHLEEAILECANTMSIKDILEELSTKEFELDELRVRIFLSNKNVRPLSSRDVAMNYIKDVCKSKTVQQIAAKLGMSEAHVKVLAKELRIHLIVEKSDKVKPYAKELNVVKKEVVVAIKPKPLTLPELKRLREEVLAGRVVVNLDVIEREIYKLEGPKPVNKFWGKDKLTQTDSTYGIAKELWESQRQPKRVPRPKMGDLTI